MKRSGPIARRTTLRSSSPPRARKLTPRKSERVRDSAYLVAVKSLPCRARGLSPCEGVVEADHQGRRPMGRKCNDDEAVPLCTLHHRQRTDWTGPFKDWTGEEMRAWLLDGIRETQQLVEGQLQPWRAPW